MRSRRDEVYEVRRSLVEGMWADGWSGREIAEVLGWGKSSSVSVLRNYGYELPYRNLPYRMFEERRLAA
jgi:hypothetical protein